MSSAMKKVSRTSQSVEKPSEIRETSTRSRRRDRPARIKSQLQLLLSLMTMTMLMLISTAMKRISRISPSGETPSVCLKGRNRTGQVEADLNWRISRMTRFSDPCKTIWWRVAETMSLTWMLIWSQLMKAEWFQRSEEILRDARSPVNSLSKLRTFSINSRTSSLMIMLVLLTRKHSRLARTSGRERESATGTRRGRRRRNSKVIRVARNQQWRKKWEGRTS